MCRSEGWREDYGGEGGRGRGGEGAKLLQAIWVAQIAHVLLLLMIIAVCMQEFDIDTDRLPLGQLSKIQIQRGYDVLNRLRDALKGKDNSLEKLSSEFCQVRWFLSHGARLQLDCWLMPVYDNLEVLCNQCC